MLWMPAVANHEERCGPYVPYITPKELNSLFSVPLLISLLTLATGTDLGIGSEIVLW